MIAISLLLLGFGVLAALVITARWALKKAHGLTPSDVFNPFRS